MNKSENFFEVIESAIDSQTAFGELLTAEEKQTLIDHGTIHSAMTGEILCKQGEKDRRVFIIVMGEVEVSEGTDEHPLVITHLKRGEIFGEISALIDSARISTVRVTKPSVLLIIPCESFEKVITGRSELYSAILERYKNRLSETALRGVDLFRHLDKATLKPLIEASSISGIPEGGVIVREGEAGDYFYIIIRGTARVSHKLGNSSINLALIHSGDYFGEWSVLTGAPRAATVSAMSRVDVLRIGRGVMLEFIQNQPEVGERIDLVAHNRRESMSGSGIPESPQQLERMVKEIEDVIHKVMKD
ncbi:MAG: cyclic nucleotide-binding domain-containing protein [Gammaproteobacteria bacterium]|nr:cyclic nucleotide-binding domain-containing protein [Gammaproteobacteria bacterium]